jgi:AcrR family transcriptional regulator
VTSTTTQLDDVGVALVEAAANLLATEGPQALTVRRIAAAAGVSTMNVYSRFGSKDGVVEHLYVRGFELLAESQRAAAVTDDPATDFRLAAQAYRSFALDHATMYGVMFERAVPDFQPSPEALHAGLATLEELAHGLEGLMERGVIRRMEPMHAAALVWSTCHGVMSLELRHQASNAVDWAQVFDDACDALLRGLAPR